MATASDRAARERKQKIFVLVGGLFLLALLAFQLPKLLGGSEPTAAGTTTDTATVAGETAPPGDGAVSTPVALTDTDRPLAPGPGQLRSFGTFTRKDPFVQQLKTPTSTESGSGGSAPDAGKAADDREKPAAPERGFTLGGEAALSVTVISVNGARQTLRPGMAFPRADPVFVLVAEQPRSKSVVVSVAGGAYANGDRGTRLEMGEPLVLVNTATGARYRLVLVSVGNGQAAPTPTREEESAPPAP